METNADLPGYFRSRADIKLNRMFGDHPHDNNGTHLDGNIPDDCLWQRWWKWSSKLSTTNVLQGHVGRRFMNTLANEFRGILDRTWNSERPLSYARLILQTTGSSTLAPSLRPSDRSWLT